MKPTSPFTLSSRIAIALATLSSIIGTAIWANLPKQPELVQEESSAEPEPTDEKIEASLAAFRKVATVLGTCESEVSYIGLLGPKSRTGKLIRRLHQLNQLPTADRLEQIHTPVGLDIGAKNTGPNRDRDHG